MYDLSNLPQQKHEKCVECETAVENAVDLIIVVSGVEILIGKDQDENDVFIKNLY